MKYLYYISTLLLLFTTSVSRANTAITKTPEISIEQHLAQLDTAINDIQIRFEQQYNTLSLQIATANQHIENSATTDQKLKWLLTKDKLRQSIATLAMTEQSEISKIRYIKGLQIIKILYEKTLALDHHFSSVTTLNEINKMANPNYYPEFAEMKGVISLKEEKKVGFDISTLLGNNIYTSVIHSFVSLFNNPNATKKEKETNLEDIECILDFTLRMHTDLNTIYFETAFLQKSNETIMTDLQQLFVDFTKPIQYNTPLKECRNTDDWDSVNTKLNSFIEVMATASLDPSQQYRAHKMAIDLEFPIDRLLQFITQYNAFIDQGGKFYEKFAIMLNSYENEQQCSSKIPREYNKLKEGIAVSIEKFNTAYKPVEINGSKMKEVLYGLNEYN